MTCPLPQEKFAIELIPVADGVRICVSEDGVVFSDELAEDWAHAFREVGVRRCIITKFDTSRRVGAALSAAYEGKLALAHFSEAPFIADGLIDASPTYLARRLVIEQPARIAQSL